MSIQENLLPLEVPNLVSPLCHDTQRVLQERPHDQKATNGGKVGLKGLRVDVDVVLNGASENAKLFEGVIGIGCSVTGGRS